MVFVTYTYLISLNWVSRLSLQFLKFAFLVLAGRLPLVSSPLLQTRSVQADDLLCTFVSMTTQVELM